MRSGSGGPDFEGAINCALQLLRSSLSPSLTYHSAVHTGEDVLPAARRLARLSGIDQHESQLLSVAAAFHDVGYIRGAADHEAVSITIASQTLATFGFEAEQIDRVATIIVATQMPQSPTCHLGELLADADLDSLGRDDFLDVSRALWLELGRRISWLEWLRSQQQFLREHHYFSAAARTLRDAGKAKNLAMLQAMIGEQGTAGR